MSFDNSRPLETQMATGRASIARKQTVGYTRRDEHEVLLTVSSRTRAP